jgi:precorrin-2 dehydrogenase/sirohydrochlorin ferrochelatase
MKLYPVMMNLEKRLSIVIGGGGVAARKIADLFEAGAVVKVISPDFVPEITEMNRMNPQRIELVQRKYVKGDLQGAVLVFSATDNRDVNAAVYAESEEHGILVNAVDDPPNCSFYVPSFVRRGDLIFALSTSGASPAMAAKLRRMLEDAIPCEVDNMLKALRRGREILKTDDSFSHIDTDCRGEILKRVVNDDDLLEKLVSCSCDNEIISFFKEISN